MRLTFASMSWPGPIFHYDPTATLYYASALYGASDGVFFFAGTAYITTRSRLMERHNALNLMDLSPDHLMHLLALVRCP